MGKTALILLLLINGPAHTLFGEELLDDTAVGLGIGHTPPAFTLPDLYSGELISLSDFRGKKTVFFMWASW